LKVKLEHSDDVEKFLVGAVEHVKKEPDTIHWFATKRMTPEGPEFGILDTFPNDEGRKAHMSGAVAAALGTKADWFREAPNIIQFDILAFKPVAKEVGLHPKAGAEVGLRVMLKAKADKIDDVKKFLSGALPLVEQEPLTAHWLALHIPNTNIFAIVDSFPSEEGKQAHIKGKVAEALFANADTLLESPPDIGELTVLAAVIN